MTRSPARRRPRRWFCRTIRDGRITIEGVIYRPNEQHGRYDGRLDGIRYAFARYIGPGNTVLPFIAQWGTERHYLHGDNWPGPECVDGGFPWYFWDAVPEAKAVAS